MVECHARLDQGAYPAYLKNTKNVEKNAVRLVTVFFSTQCKQRAEKESMSLLHPVGAVDRDPHVVARGWRIAAQQYHHVVFSVAVIVQRIQGVTVTLVVETVQRQWVIRAFQCTTRTRSQCITWYHGAMEPGCTTSVF